MLIPFLWVKWIHVLSAMTAVGANLTYRFWIAHAAREPQVLPFVLRSIRLLDRRLANPCYAVLLATGFIMAFALHMPLTTPWLLTALLLYILAAVMGIFAYAPASRRQLALLEKHGFDSKDYQDAARRGNALGVVVTLDVLLIVFLMVFKPALWG